MGGGAATLSDLHRLDIGALAWSELAPPGSPWSFGGAPRSLFGFAAAGDRLLVFGGTQSSVAYPYLIRKDLSLNDMHQVGRRECSVVTHATAIALAYCSCIGSSQHHMLILLFALLA
jgi:hypothetical protein